MISSESYAPYMRPPLSKEMWFTEDRDATKELKFTQWNGRERRYSIDIIYQVVYY